MDNEQYEGFTQEDYFEQEWLKQRQIKFRRTARDIRQLHDNLHAMKFPHDCSEFEREELKLTSLEITVNSPIHLACYHRGQQN